MIGTRHGEKLYETLATREELARAEDQGDYFRVRVDARDLNYSEYFDEGDRRESPIDDYHSHNTERLDVERRGRRCWGLPDFRQLVRAVTDRPDTVGQRAVLVHRYYWPDTPPYASMLRAIAARLDARRPHVDVLTSQPSYKPEANIAPRPATERVDDVTRAAHRDGALTAARAGGARSTWCWFPLVVACADPGRAPVRRRDVLDRAPGLAGLGGLLRRPGASARFVYHCMDLHPEIGAVVRGVLATRSSTG